MIYPSERSGYMFMSVLLFFVGFFTSINGILVTYFKNSFGVSYTIANLISMIFFLTYLLMSVPFGYFNHFSSYRKTLQISLLMGIVGCLIFVFAIQEGSYLLLLGSLFFIASLVTGIEVSANSLVDLMGDQRTSSKRLTFVHFFDSLGTVLGPQFASFIFLYSTSIDVTSDRARSLYFGLIILLITFTMIIPKQYSKRRIQHECSDNQSCEKEVSWNRLLNARLMFGIIAMFCYVGCEVSLANFLIPLATQSQIAHLAEKEAAIWISFYWGGQMIGRFLGSLFMGIIPTEKVLRICATFGSSFVLFGVFLNNNFSLYLIASAGLTNSIMYPSIFSLAIKNAGLLKSKASGWIHVGVIGGAIIPLCQGVLADLFDVRYSFILPGLLYMVIILYGIFSEQLDNNVLKITLKNYA